MDYRKVFEKLITAFETEKVRYVLMGGFALGLWGVARATVDIDFLVHRDDVLRVDAIMQKYGYERRYSSENVSQNDPSRRDADITDIKMLLQARKKEIDFALLEEYGMILGLSDLLQQLTKESGA